VNVTATASDNVGVAAVDFYVDGSLQSTSTAPPYTFAWNTTGLSNTNHTVSAVARDAAGNKATASVTVMITNTTPPNVDTTPPQVLITSPQNGGSVPRGPFTIVATASDNVSVPGVKFYVDGVQIGPESTGPAYTATWNTAAVKGHGYHTLTAVARDAAGNSATSQPVSVRVP